MMKRFLLLISLGGLLLCAPLGAGCSDSGDCEGCRIDGDCVAAGTQSGDDPCRVCDPEQSEDDYSPRNCSDGISCNGEETCDASGGDCVAGEPLCLDGEFCDPDVDQCVVSCPFCSIDRMCYWEHQRNPENPCQVCDSAEAPYAWSDYDGAVCDDGVFCNGADTCSGGSCSEHVGDPCGDDGVQCNGTESCDEAAGACVHSDDVCGEGESCDVDADECCADHDHLGCDANGDVVWMDSCDNPQELVEDCPAAPAGGCAAGECACSAGWMGPQCDQCIVHVSTTGDDGNSGGSWSQAMATLPAAIAAADATGCSAIWVADGTYITSNTDDPTEAFVLTPGLQLYGGFAGTEINLAERDPAAHLTVLDGSIGDPTLTWDDACKVVQAATGARIDGFTIRRGDGLTGCVDNYRGVGLLVDGGEVTVANCVIADNGDIGNYGGMLVTGSALVKIRNTLFQRNDGNGGALSVYGDSQVEVTDSVFRENEGNGALAIWVHGNAVLTATRCRFEDNANPLGHAVVESGSNTQLTLTSCVFIGNSARMGCVETGGINTTIVNCLFADNEGEYAGAIYAGGSGPTVIQNCTVAANVGDYTGGINAGSYFTVVRNSVIWGNTSNAASTSESQILHGSASLPLVRYSTVEGTLFPGEGNQNTDPLFVNGDPGQGPVDLHLGAGSPCIDTGSTSLLLPDEADLDDDGNLVEPTPLDLDGLPRVVGVTVDKGAYEMP